MIRQDEFIFSQCTYCEYRYSNDCKTHPHCVGCPMYFRGRKGIKRSLHCHCLVKTTAEEHKTGKCKFFKEAKADEG